jgi:hypothetical protein
MAAKDKYHELVKTALVKDGWTITDDPLKFEADGKKIKIDLGAERLITAERGAEKIAVEVKSFVGASPITEYYAAIGQFSHYQTVLEENQPERILYLAIPQDTFNDLFKGRLTQKTLTRLEVSMIVYSIELEKITLWKK